MPASLPALGIAPAPGACVGLAPSPALIAMCGGNGGGGGGGGAVPVALTASTNVTVTDALTRLS